MTIAQLFSLGTCIVQIQSVRVNFACTKKLFNLSAEAIINVRNARLCARRAIFLLKIKQIPFSSRLVKGFTILKRVQNQFKMLSEMCIVLARIVSTERNENLLTVMQQLRDPFMVVENVEPGCLFTELLLCYRSTWRRQKHKTPFFFAKKRWTWYPTNNCYLMPHFNQPNIERKKCVWTTKYERLQEMCIVQHEEMKSVFSFQQIKRLVSATVKSETCCHVLNVPFMDQTPTIMLFGSDGTHCFARKTSRDYEKEKPSPFLKKFLRQSQTSTSKHIRTWTKKGRNYSINGIFVSTPHWLTELTKTTFTIFFYTLSVNIKAKWFSQSPTRVLSGLSTLDQIQWLEMTISSQENPLAAWSLLLSQTQQFLNNHLARVPVTPNQQGTHEMRDEVLSSVGVQDMDTSGYQVSAADLDDVEF